MGFYKRNRSLFLMLLGAGLMAISVCWEYVRMAPDYRYIVEPWSLRGYQTTLGWVIMAGALAVLALAVPLSLRLLKGRLLESIIVAAAVTAFATVVPIVAKAPERDLGGLPSWGLAFLLGIASLAVAGRLLPAALPGIWRRLILLAVLAGITAIAGLFIYGPLLGGGAVALWIPMLIFWITCAAIMILRPPVELSSYRLLLIGVTLVWIVSLACAGPLRTGLMGQQLAEGVLRRDVQITSGVFIAWAGGLLAFAGAVALWARRRDELQAHSRAGQQLAVAAISAAELEEAV